MRAQKEVKSIIEKFCIFSEENINGHEQTININVDFEDAAGEGLRRILKHVIGNQIKEIFSIVAENCVMQLCGKQNL